MDIFHLVKEPVDEGEHIVYQRVIFNIENVVYFMQHLENIIKIIMIRHLYSKISVKNKKNLENFIIFELKNTLLYLPR